jgi:ABC-type sugar transport system ATPase subunit
MVRMMVGRDLKDFFKVAAGNGAAERDGGFEVRRLRTIRYPNHTISFNVAKGEVLGLPDWLAPVVRKWRGQSLVSRKHSKPKSYSMGKR